MSSAIKLHMLELCLNKSRLMLLTTFSQSPFLVGIRCVYRSVCGVIGHSLAKITQEKLDFEFVRNNGQNFLQFGSFYRTCVQFVVAGDCVLGASVWVEIKKRF